jgi:hypothetical protein
MTDSYAELREAWGQRMEYLRAGDLASAIDVWGKAVRRIYGPGEYRFLNWRVRDGTYLDCLVNNVLFFEANAILVRVPTE